MSTPFNNVIDYAILTALKNTSSCADHFLKIIPKSICNNALRLLLNTIFKDELSTGQLNYLQNKWLKLEVIDLNQHWYISVKNQNFIINSKGDENVTFIGKVDDFSLLAAGEADPDMLFFNRRLHINGETELGLMIKSTLENLETAQIPVVVNFINQQHCRLLKKYGVHS